VGGPDAQAQRQGDCRLIARENSAMKMNFCRIMRLLAMRYGDAEAVVNVERNRRFSFREYHLLGNRIANALQRRFAVDTGDTFLLILDNDNLALFQCPTFLKQRGTAVMTNLRDSFAEHGWQIELVKPKVVFIETRLLDAYYDLIRARGSEIVVMDRPAQSREGVHSFWDVVEESSDSDTDVELDVLAHTPLLRFTGGTTGRGKCAMYSVDNVMAMRDGALLHPGLQIDSSTRFLHVTPLSHASQLGFVPTLFLGGANLTLNQVDLSQWAAAVEAERVTHSILVPTVLYRLLDLQKAMPRDFKTLKTILYGAAPMSPSRLAELIECFGPVFVQAYAATESVMFISLLDKGDHRTDGGASTGRLASAGRTTPGMEVYVADSTGRALPPGEIGEIRVRSRGLIQGYYRNPEGTAAEFADGAWKSGDLGYLDEGGYLFIVDRTKDMIITGGFNVYAAEVEAALHSHPAVALSAVVSVPHPEWGEAVHAEVVLRPGMAATAEELIAHAKTRIATFKAPKGVSFVEALPVSAVGKVIRRQVKEKYWSRMSRSVA
jgi:fatty-acyl-CoA synthase